MLFKYLLNLYLVVLCANPVFAVVDSPLINRWIVRFDESVSDFSSSSVQSLNCENITSLDPVKNDIFVIDCDMDLNELSSQISKISNEYIIEQDSVVSFDVTWGQDRLWHELDSVAFSGSSGESTTYYSVDTGVYPVQSEFQNRVTEGISTLNGIMNPNGNTDCHGHGTHTSSTAAGSLYGIANKAKIVPVRVLGCTGSGTNSGIVMGLRWILDRGTKRSVVGLSLGGPFSNITNQVIKELHDNGYIISASAGNSKANSCYSSPASAREALTVCASDINDDFVNYASWGSNWGSCVDLCAPGADVCAMLPNGNRGCWSGTSMSQPHVAGTALHFWSRKANRNKNNVQIENIIMSKSIHAVKNIIYPNTTDRLVSMTG